MLNLYNHPVKSIFVFFILTIILSVSAINIEFGEKQNSKYTVYTIEFDYFGMDAAKLEEIITNPLEEQLMAIPGILEFKSNIEYSKSITTLYFSKKEDAKKNYLTIRSIVENYIINCQKMYKNLVYTHQMLPLREFFVLLSQVIKLKLNYGII